MTELRPLPARERDHREQAQQLRFLDAGLWLGPPQGFPLARELAPAELAPTLARYHLTGGLVSHWNGYAVSAQDGNQDLAAVFGAAPAPVPDLAAVWTALPLDPRERGPLPGVGELPAWVGAVRIFPNRHRFPLASWCVGSLGAWLRDRRLPLLVWHTEADWSSLHALAREFPELPLVIETQPQKILYHTRPLFALLRACPNVFLETSNFAGAGFIEHAVGEFGASRLIYGSFLPVADPWVPIGMVLDAAIAATDKQLIAGDNLRRLLREVRR